MIVWSVSSHNVSKEITPEDIVYIEKYLGFMDAEGLGFQRNGTKNLNYEQQVNLIKQIQESVISSSPSGNGIPLGTARNPKDLFLAKQGLCYDRSYTLEKTYNYVGFEARHISVFEHKTGSSGLSEFFSKNTASHAISEVKTTKGWLIVDTNYPWLGLDSQDAPVSFEKLKKNGFKIDWQQAPHPETDKFYNHPTVFLYGFYSRHGKFYPPYDFIPDYRIQELIQNF